MIISTRVQKERPANVRVLNLNRRVANNDTHYKCWCVCVRDAMISVKILMSVNKTNNCRLLVNKM